MEATDLHLATDNHEIGVESKSIFDSASDVVTKGVPLTGLSVYNSFVNTGVDVANWFGADIENNDPERQLAGYDDDLLRYYTDHKDAIEAAGLITGSFIPGLTAVKALRLAQSGRFGQNIARATGIMSGKKQAILDGAIEQINAGEASLFGTIQRDKWKAIAYGFGDQALQAAAWETATVATMKANPLLDKAGMEDVLSHVFWGTVVGGGVGGVLEGIGIRGLLNKALLQQDTKEKVFDVATRLGIGEFNAGDRVVKLIEAVDNMPPPNTASSTAKAARTRQQAELDSWKILKTISPDADENLGKGFMDALYRMKNESQLSNEEMYDYLARLARVSRVNSSSHISTDNIFYVNRFGKQYEYEAMRMRNEGKDEGFLKILEGRKAAESVSSRESDLADYSMAYTVKDQTQPVRISHFDDFIEVTGDGTKRANKYNNRAEAFAAGEDIFIDAKLHAHINPAATNIKRVPHPGRSNIDSEEYLQKVARGADPAELRAEMDLPKPLGAPLYFNLATGKVSSRAYAVVGDIAPIPQDPSKILNYNARGYVTGIKIGDFSSNQFVENGFSYRDLSALDSNARYVWAKLRGLKAHDIINYDDIPLLEEAVRLGEKDGMLSISELGIKFRERDGTLTAIDRATVVKHLQDRTWKAKDEVIANLLGDGSAKVDAAEVALKANVPQKYLEEGMVAKEYSDVAIPVEQYLRTNTVKLDYDIGNVAVQEGNILRGMVDVQYRIDMAQNQARNAIVNFFKEDWERFVVPGSSSESNILGAGPSAFTSSNAEYGTLAQRAEGTGANVARKMQERHSYVSDRFTSDMQALRDDPQAGAELGVITNIGRRIARRFAFLPEELATKYKVSPDTIVLEESIIRDEAGKITGWDKTYIPRDGNWTLGSRFGAITAENAAAPRVGAFTYYGLSPKVAQLLRTSTELNNERLIHHNNWMSAQGIARKYDLDSVYFPPIDTTKHKFVALVRQADGVAFGTSDAAALVADSAEGLQKKVALILRDQPDARISFKGTSKDYHEALGDYDYSLNMVESAVDSNLRKKGILSDLLPNVRGEAVAKEYFDWHIRQETRLIRNHVELANAQLFDELRALGKKFVEVETSQTGQVAGRFFSQVSDPFNQYIKTALNISEKQEYRLWQDVNEKVEAFAATAFRTAKETLGQADKGLITFDKAVELTTKFGLGNPYQRTLEHLAENGGLSQSAGEAFREANRLPLQPVLSRFVQKANSVLAATTLRLDAFQSLINIVSTPVLLSAEFASVKNNPALKELLTTELPNGTGSVSPAYSKILYSSVANFFGPEKEALIGRYRSLGTVRELSSDYHEMLNSLTIAGSETAKKLEELGEKAVKLGVKISRSDWSEEFVRFVASDTARQLFEAQGVVGRALDDNIRTFVNRVHGNYISAQRPVAFQGPIGQAVGLFQTYQFNLLQQVFRYVENREALPLAMLFGIQGSLFGMQGIPGFQAMNTHIIGNAASNPDHKDFYSQVPQFFDKKLGDWLLYGSVSQVLQTGLYSRGDINPRQITILPVNPLDFPAVGAGIRFVQNLIDTGSKLKDGGKFSDTLLQGLEHNGLSRPLTGLGQIVQGYTTTSKGSLISAANDWDGITTASRIAGARPLDEAIALDALYRKTAYQAKDTARIAQLGEAVKTTLVKNQTPSQDQVQSFAARYAAEGGRIENFGKKMVEWTRDANQSRANEIYRSLKSPLAQNMMRIMGGDQLPDFTNAASTATPPVEPQ